jgi:frataxin
MTTNRLRIFNLLFHLNPCRTLQSQKNKIVFLKPTICSSQLQASSKCFSMDHRAKSNKDTQSPFSFQTLSEPNNSKTNEISAELKQNYETIAEETLESLSDKFDCLTEDLDDGQAKYYDVEYSSGVLNIKLGPKHGTYVLNKQSPNFQIWLSSPSSGPKRFDFVDNTWIYKRTNESLHALLSQEISKCFNKQIDFTECSHGKRK